MVASSPVSLRRSIIPPVACSVLAILAIWLRFAPILASCLSSSGSAVFTFLGLGGGGGRLYWPVHLPH